jgi:hypothetical protein
MLQSCKSLSKAPAERHLTTKYPNHQSPPKSSGGATSYYKILRPSKSPPPKAPEERHLTTKYPNHQSPPQKLRRSDTLLQNILIIKALPQKLRRSDTLLQNILIIKEPLQKLRRSDILLQNSTTIKKPSSKAPEERHLLPNRLHCLPHPELTAFPMHIGISSFYQIRFIPLNLHYG